MDHGGEPAQKRKYTKKAKLGVSDDTSSNDGGGGISAADLKMIGSMFTSQGNRKLQPSLKLLLHRNCN